MAGAKPGYLISGGDIGDFRLAMLANSISSWFKRHRLAQGVAKRRTHGGSQLVVAHM